MNKEKPQSIEQKLEMFPPLPVTVNRVMAVTGDPSSSANDLMKAILPDQAMCVSILKIANSVIYGRPRKVNSLETAIVVLGFDEIRNIVLGKAAVKTSQEVLIKYKKQLARFWNHSFTCGLAAKIIAEHLGQSPGQFFIAGLLHDIGKLAMLLAYGDKYDTAQWMQGITLPEKYQKEKKIFSVTHDQIGGHLLKRWQFPDSLVTSLQYHHCLEAANTLQAFPLVIQLADFLAFLTDHPERVADESIYAVLYNHLPEFEEQWQDLNIPWDDSCLESWFAWLKVDRNHGSAILDILAY